MNVNLATTGLIARAESAGTMYALTKATIVFCDVAIEVNVTSAMRMRIVRQRSATKGNVFSIVTIVTRSALRKFATKLESVVILHSMLVPSVHFNRLFLRQCSGRQWISIAE